jgi:hypothetical protein
VRNPIKPWPAICVFKGNACAHFGNALWQVKFITILHAQAQ